MTRFCVSLLRFFSTYLLIPLANAFFGQGKLIPDGKTFSAREGKVFPGRKHFGLARGNFIPGENTVDRGRETYT
jgi:hypothetical protein